LDLHTNTLHFYNEQTHETETVTTDKVFATDGAFSAVRLAMQKHMLFDYSQKYLTHGYKELVIPALPDGSHQLDKNCLHIWPRGEYMMIALANLDGSFTCTLFFPLQGENSFDTLKTTDQVEAFFKQTFPDAVKLMPTLLTDYFQNPTGTMIMVRCEPWNYEDKVILFGDAAHAIVPFYGQGMNCGFEDCTVFMEMFEQANGNWNGLLEAFSKQRVPDANAILDLALANYIEMRDKTADANFLLQKKIENKFSKLHPELWIPLYSQVTFSNIRYSEAIQAGKKQDAIMQEVLSWENIHQTWDEPIVMEKMMKLVSNQS